MEYGHYFQLLEICALAGSTVDEAVEATVIRTAPEFIGKRMDKLSNQQLIDVIWAASRLGWSIKDYYWLEKAWNKLYYDFSGENLRSPIMIQRLLVAGGWGGGLRKSVVQKVVGTWEQVKGEVIVPLREYEEVEEALKIMEP